jgi:Ca2+-binding RTX toxin-like protein
MSLAKLYLDDQVFKQGNYSLLNNVWGKGSLLNGVNYIQQIVYDRNDVTDNVSFNWNWPKAKGSIVAYPEIVWGDSPRYDGADESHSHVSQISGLGAFDVDFNISVASGSQFNDIAFDLWLTSKPLGDVQTITTEVMVWLDETAAPVGTKVATLGTGNDAASVYQTVGRSDGHTWSYLAVVFDKPHLNGNVDLKEILTDLAAKHLVSSSDYVSGYHLGAEISGGKGSMRIDDLHTDFSTAAATGDMTLFGTANPDVLVGGAGNDLIYGSAGSDRLDGGAGIDTVDYHSSTAGVTIDLNAGTAAGGLAGGDRIANFENVNGTDYNDTLLGSAAGNVLTAGAGNDKLDGRAGNDTLVSGGGSDRLIGGAGADQMTGGKGGDWFVFLSGDSTPAAMDTITDFNYAEGDRMDLSMFDANTGAAGTQDFKFIGTAAFHGVAGELRYDKTATDTHIYADTNGDGKVDFAVHLDGPQPVFYQCYVF